MRSQDFERLYAEHAQPLLNLMLYRTGERGLAEDLVADTFEKAFRARRRFNRRRAAEKTWLYTIALNCLRDHLRRTRAESRALEGAWNESVDTDTIRPLAQVDDRDLLERGMESLSVEEREAIALRYGAELTVPEIAQLLRIPLSTAEGRVYGALRKLRSALPTPPRRSPTRAPPPSR